MRSSERVLGFGRPGSISLPVRSSQSNQEGCSMQILRVVIFTVCTVLFCAILAPGARADQWDKKTIVTFGDAVEIPGQVLPAGTYVFKLDDTLADRHLVQIWNADETQIFATIRTIPNTRFEPPDQTIFEFDERSGD